MKVHIHYSPAGEILGLHQSAHENSKVAVKGRDLATTDLDESLARMDFKKIAAEYKWHHEKKELTKK